MTPPLGIGIITYNRRDLLIENIRRVRWLTSCPYELVVAEDGGGDGSVEWCNSERVRVVTGPNRGAAWNRNRTLHYLMTRTDCDPILLLEDDLQPTTHQWWAQWMRAIRLWNFIIWAHPGLLSLLKQIGGDGSPESPYFMLADQGNCFGLSRYLVENVGYFDTRYQGTGWEDSDYTHRCARAGFFSAVHRLSISADMEQLDPPRLNTCLANEKVFSVSAHETPIYREPWRTIEDRLLLEGEIEASTVLTTSNHTTSNLPPGFLSDSAAACLSSLAENKIVLEVGAYLGKSTTALARTAKIVHTVDPCRATLTDLQDPSQSKGLGICTLGLLQNHLRDSGVLDRVIVHAGKSQDVLPIFPVCMFDMVFIDGDHSEQAAAHDTMYAMRLVKPGGTVVWDDYVDAYKPVKEAVDAAVLTYNQISKTPAKLKRIGDMAILHV